MLCPKCMKREANVFFTKIVNGKKEEIKLCDECAKKAGLISQNGLMFEMSDFISDFLGKGFEDKPLINKTYECPFCHTTLEQFARTSMFGCGECYDTFADYLEPFMKEIQGTSTHIGKLPARTKSSTIKKRKLTDLKSKLSAAIADERFEEAAKFRDEIKKLSDEIKSESGEK